LSVDLRATPDEPLSKAVFTRVTERHWQELRRLAALEGSADVSALIRRAVIKEYFTPSNVSRVNTRGLSGEQEQVDG
jgi:hypothetical protein